ncbi:MAG TPA: lipopolysaccharide kinase InaA family protein [Holophagaceae bacterium]|jgi:hypothetical protein|nr:lipopolysaccharide kinase InaA family protein [Holophagaceae bacterium]
MTDTNLIPSLPEDWPYQPRTVLPALEIREGVDIPGCGGGWTLEGCGLDLRGQSGAMKDTFGRGGVRRLGDAVLRPYRRGGWMAKVNGRVYASASRFRRELGVHRALWEAGFPTMEPLGLAWRRTGLGVEGLYFTRFTEAKPWPSDWSAPLMSELVKAIHALSAWGLYAPDLNATNVMWGAGGPVLLDWDRAAWTGGSLLPRYHARLMRSLAKLGAPVELRAALDQGFLGRGSSRS